MDKSTIVFTKECHRCFEEKPLTEFCKQSNAKDGHKNWCKACDKHYARCKCETPQFYVRCNGQDATAQFPQADLSKR